MPNPRLMAPIAGAALLLTTLCLAPAVRGTTGSETAALQALAAIAYGPGQVTWWPGADLPSGVSLVLAVSDPTGNVRTRRFGPGALPIYALVDAHGDALPDGTYTWELRAVSEARGAWGIAAVRREAQSGSFTLLDGRLVPPGLPETGPEAPKGGGPALTHKDQTVPDDLIVDGKGCIGLGCAANEGFFQEALRLKQSVVRLRFEDTSAQPTFPSGDWQLTANDAASGGVNRFSLDDLSAGTTPVTVQAGAPSHSIYLNGQGRLGLGTAVPAAHLHLVASAPGDAVMRVQNTSPTGYAGIEFIDDGGTPGFFFGVNNNTLPHSTRLNSFNSFPFLLMTNSQERIKIQANGNIAFGGLATATNPLQHANGAFLSTGGTWTNASSRSLKQGIRGLDSQAALAAFEELKPVEFSYKADPSEHHVGFIAEDVPELVATQDRTGLSPMDIVAVLTKVVQDQQKEIAAQKDQVRSLEERLAALENHQRQVEK